VTGSELTTTIFAGEGAVSFGFGYSLGSLTCVDWRFLVSNCVFD
jgi:hypothetical protein